jgi:arylsulfatase
MTLHRRQLGFLLGTAMIWMFVGNAQGERPNFVVIFVDDVGYADVGCFGSKRIKTPNLDRMAAQGMKFTSFYAQPICGPSRAALMTGCYPNRVAERRNLKNTHPVLHEKEITMAEVLKSAGYATGCFGKWDLATHSQRNFIPELMPNHQGFDYFFGTPTSNDGFVDLYRNEELIEKRTDMNTLTRRYTDEVIGFMQKHRKEPFFVYLPHTMPHTRLGVSKAFRGKSQRGLYGDVMEEIDHETGRLIDAVKRLDLEKNTVVLFTSDNGPWLIKNKGQRDGSLPGDHGGSAGPLRSGKVSTWEGGVRVPTIFWSPGRIPAGKTCQALATTMDILPTFAALAGARVPTDRIIDGENIAPLLDGRFEKANAEKAYFYYLRTHLQAVRQGKWKLHLPRPAQRPWLGGFAKNNHIAATDDISNDRPLLFDLDADIGETTDVADMHADVVERLSVLAQKARRDLGDYNRIGEGVRFFDKGPRRPDAAAWLKAEQPSVKIFAGSGRAALTDGTGTKAAFNQPFGICLGAKGTLYVADSANHCIRKISSDGVVSTYAGNGQKGTIDGPPGKVQFDTPSGVRVDGKGNLYVFSYEENSIRVIDARGNVRSVIATRKEGYRDGRVSEARIRAPRGVVFDRQGNLFFSDCWNHRIRKITPEGIVSTLAGGGPTGETAKVIWRDGTGSQARFFAPCGMAIDGDDNLYVADAENHRIRKITPRGVVTTLAGHGASGKAGRGFADGPAATSRLNTPTEVFVTMDGTVYFSDTYGNRVRKISPRGIVSTVAGTGRAGLRDGPVNQAEFNFPRGLVVRQQTLLLADFNNHVVREVGLK